MKQAIIVGALALTASQPPSSLPLNSSIPGLRLVPTTELPRNRAAKPVDEYCSNYAIDRPKSAGGRLATKAGWIVTSEAKLGRYDAVVFVRELEGATSGTCYHYDGNLAVFDGPTLGAIAYWKKSSDSYLGYADQIDPRRIRLNTGMPGAPFADMVLRNGVSIEPIAPKDTVCDGQASVPNVFGEGIRKARKKLLAFGWKPVSAREDFGGFETQMRADGIIEAESCSGTGHGFCTFSYRHAKGFSLSILTTDEEPRVSSYDVQCRRRKVS